jgi:uridine kinase
LRDGQPVEAPVYDFARFARQSRTVTLAPGRAIIVEGILIYTDAALRRLMDVKVFVDTDDDTRFIRRLQRDIAERGRTVQSVIDQYLGTVKPMHLEVRRTQQALRGHHRAAGRPQRGRHRHAADADPQPG